MAGRGADGAAVNDASAWPMVGARDDGVLVDHSRGPRHVQSFLIEAPNFYVLDETKNNKRLSTKILQNR